MSFEATQMSEASEGLGTSSHVPAEDQSPCTLLICDRCEKTRRVSGEGPFEGRWTCCYQPTKLGVPELAPSTDRKGKAPEAALASTSSSFSSASCLRTRSMPVGLSGVDVARCCDVPDKQVCAIVGGARVAHRLLTAGIATQESLAALDTTDTNHVAVTARVNEDAFLEWIAVARGKELDEIMADILAPASDDKWSVKSVFARLEERAGVSTPADLVAVPVETTLLPALRDLGISLRDTALWRARATARLAAAPAWMKTAKLEFPEVADDDDETHDTNKDTTNQTLLKVALDTMQTHPDVNATGEAIRYLYRIACNVAESPDEKRFRKLRVDNQAYVAHAMGVKGGTLAMESLGWQLGDDGSAVVLPESQVIGTHTLQTLKDRIKAMVAKFAARENRIREVESRRVICCCSGKHPFVASHLSFTTRPH